MRTSYFGFCLPVLGLLAAAAACAQVPGFISLDISIPTQPPVVSVGSSINADINISGLNGTKAGAYEIMIQFNPGLLSVQNVTFGNGLNHGDPANSIPSWNVVNNVLHACVDVQEVSLLGDLSAQPAAFTLFTVTFAGITPGLADLTFTQTDFSDQAGVAFVPPIVNGSQITVVPEPELVATASGLGLVLLGGWRLRNRR